MSTRAKAEAPINETAWKIGWNPKPALLGAGLLALIIGTLLIDFGWGIFLGAVGLAAGAGVWLWGVSEVNDKYAALEDAFNQTSIDHGLTKSGFDGEDESTDVHVLRTHNGKSAPLIEAHKKYFSDIIVVGETSFFVSEDYTLDMENISVIDSSSGSEVYYRDVELVESYSDGPSYALLIRTNGGIERVVQSADRSSISKVETELRKRVRAGRRQ